MSNSSIFYKKDKRSTHTVNVYGVFKKFDFFTKFQILPYFWWGSGKLKFDSHKMTNFVHKYSKLDCMIYIMIPESNA